jgi:hypothetical protein
MIRRALRLPTFLIMALAIAIALAGYARALVEDGILNMDMAIATEQTIQLVRDLKLTRPVSFNVITPAALGRMLARGETGQPSDREISAYGAAGAMIGLFPRGIDLKSASIRAMQSQLLAFYDFNRRRMVVIDGGPFSQAQTSMRRRDGGDTLGYLILAHELTHALQDQNFQLGERLRRLHGDADRELALRSVAEGDATLAGWGYARGRMDASTVAMLDRHIEQAARSAAAGAPDSAIAAYDYFNFPYSEGVRFVGAAYRRGGWAAVDALYRNPPQSTQQIIDPALYFSHPLPPLDVNVAGYERPLPQWRRDDSDVIGELGLQVILQRSFGMNAPEAAIARRWAGDRIVVLRRGKRYGVIWMIAFRDADSARQFGATYARLLRRIPGDTPYIEARSNAVLVMAGFGAPLATVPIWRASTIRGGGAHPSHAPATAERSIMAAAPTPQAR